MKKAFLFTAFLGFLGTIIYAFTFLPGNNKLSVTNNLQRSAIKEGNAVVELFTSEGCSSCPPAETVMKELQKQYSDRNVYFLEYHVDYWDRLGWKDRFSDVAFTKRQNEYATRLQLETIYTPQAIVNGTTECVGSNKQRLTELIEKNISSPAAEPSIGFILEHHTKNVITLSFPEKLKLSTNEKMQAALVQKTATVQIKRGENEGLQIMHYNTVLQLQEGTGKDRMNFTIDENLLPENLSVILFIQNSRTGEIRFITQKQII